jgi:hypothetical protein
MTGTESCSGIGNVRLNNRANEQGKYLSEMMTDNSYFPLATWNATLSASSPSNGGFLVLTSYKTTPKTSI